MKIKRDFVTNSSSCSYIVCIPDVELFIKKIEEKNIISDEIKKSIKNHYGYMNFEDDDISYNEFFEKIHKVAEAEGYVIMFNENGSENEPQYMNIAFDKKQIEKLKKVLKDF
jgi:hypothetical protein